MSFASTVENAVNEFIVVISRKYNLDKGELVRIWNFGDAVPCDKTREVSRSVATSILAENLTEQEISGEASDALSEAKLKKLSKKELEDLCRKHGVKVTGTKPELIARLQDPANNQAGNARGRKTPPQSQSVSPRVNRPNVDVVKPAVNKASLPPVVTVPEKKVPSKTTAVPPVLKGTKNSLFAAKSAYGNTIIPNTSLVVDPRTKRVIGREDTDGTVYELTDEDMELCKQKKYPYDMPETITEEVVPATVVDGIPEPDFLDQIDGGVPEEDEIETEDEIELTEEN